MSGTNVLVSAGASGYSGNGVSTQPAISGDGRYVTFASFATNLMAGDTNHAEDVFLRDVLAGTNSLVSVTPAGGFGDGNSFQPSISTDGRFVLFYSFARNLTNLPAQTSALRLFLRDLPSKITYQMTTGAVLSASMTPDGHLRLPPPPSPQTKVRDSFLGKIFYTQFHRRGIGGDRHF